MKPEARRFLKAVGARKAMEANTEGGLVMEVEERAASMEATRAGTVAAGVTAEVVEETVEGTTAAGKGEG